jgi:hypothetical protein
MVYYAGFARPYRTIANIVQTAAAPGLIGTGLYVQFATVSDWSGSIRIGR